VLHFIVDYIDSVPALEALLLMRRNPEREWKLAEIAGELYMDPVQLAPMMTILAQRGLCRQIQGDHASYAASPTGPELTATLDRLAETYRRYLVAVTNEIHRKPRPGVRGFPDAFRLRGSE
jgi:hypothetical protein